MKQLRIRKEALFLALLFAITLIGALKAFAHCDTMDGPVISDAKMALGKGDVTGVLEWVKPEYEAQVRAAFDKVMAVRGKGEEAKELADRYFFETLVRLHRAGEGAPYTGLKPTGTELEPAVVEADKALESGSVDSLVNIVTEDVASGIRERFERALEAKKHKDESVEAGREFVEAYVEFVHYVERIHMDAAKGAHHKQESAEGHSEH